MFFSFLGWVILLIISVILSGLFDYKILNAKIIIISIAAVLMSYYVYAGGCFEWFLD